MMTIHKKSANVVGGRTARACDACVRRRARWYCTADDAFLCQVCDISVHSANQLASRHERVRLESSGIRKSSSVITEPSWLHGFTKKARSRRHAHINNKAISNQEGDKADFSLNPLPLVPDIIGSEATSIFDENDERILYQVPVFNPFACEEPTFEDYESKVNYEHGGINDLEGFNHLPSENELAEFTAHMESLLREEGSCDEKCGRVKVEDHAEGEETIEAALELKFDQMDDAMREISDWKFEYEATMIEQEVIDEEKVTSSLVEPTIKNNKMALKLNYDDVITSWANQGSPWQTGIRPEFNLDDCWPDFKVTCPTNHNHRNRDIGGNMGYGDGEREARVTRYKEKRRTRLFSKKIRYEVRKLNAEKRPRMRGRFVKRTSFPVSIFPTK